MRKPLKETTCRAQAKQLEGHPSPDAVVMASISAGWQGLFPDRVTNVLPIRGGKPGRPPLAEGQFYHPDWESGTKIVCHIDTHDRDTGYSLEYMRKRGLI